MDKYKLNLKDQALETAKIRYTQARESAPGTALKWNELTAEQQIEIAKKYWAVAVQQLAFTAQTVRTFLEGMWIEDVITLSLIAQGLVPEPEEPAATGQVMSISDLKKERDALLAWKQQCIDTFAPLLTYAENHPEIKVGDSKTDFVLKIAKERDKALSVVRALMTTPHLNLGDLVYLVREREGKGWEGPAVVAWGNAVGNAEELLKEAAAEGQEK